MRKARIINQNLQLTEDERNEIEFFMSNDKYLCPECGSSKLSYLWDYLTEDSTKVWVQCSKCHFRPNDKYLTALHGHAYDCKTWAIDAWIEGLKEWKKDHGNTERKDSTGTD